MTLRNLGTLSPASFGTVTTGATTVADEHGDGVWHLTKLTMTAFSLGNVGDNASLGIGNKFYTFPAGTILVDYISLKGGAAAAVNVTAQTPEFGVGSVIASGAVSVLSGTATFEDYIDGNASGGTGGDTLPADINGTAFYKLSRDIGRMIIKTSGGKSHDLFLNAAAAWSDVTAAAPLLYTGVITMRWMLIS